MSAISRSTDRRRVRSLNHATALGQIFGEALASDTLGDRSRTPAPKERENSLSSPGSLTAEAVPGIGAVTPPWDLARARAIDGTR